jgi:hypothetical protein
MDEKALEKILCKRNETRDAERAALAEGRWAEFLSERIPPPSRLSFLRYKAWRSAYEKALSMGTTTKARRALIFPIWYAENESEDPLTKWAPATVALFDDESYQLSENGSPGDVLVLANVEEARLGFIAPANMYAPDVELPYRNGHYVTCESRRIERVVEIERAIAAPGLPAPGRAVPAFSTGAELAIALPQANADLDERIGRATERLRISPEREPSSGWQ